MKLPQLPPGQQRSVTIPINGAVHAIKWGWKKLFHRKPKEIDEDGIVLEDDTSEGRERDGE